MAPINPLDPAVFNQLATSLTYAKLYPLIQKDFMGKMDCKQIHTPPNQIANTVGGPTAQSGQVICVIQGGSDILASAKKIEYEAIVQSGDIDHLIEVLG
jgi:hypothetical protein